jgi:hypothetical protein
MQAVMNSIQVGEPSGESPFDLPTDVTPVPPGETIPLTAGAFVSGSFVEDSYQDYTVQGVAGAPLAIAISPTTGFDVVLEVYDASDLESSLLRVDDGLSGDPEVAEFTPEADGEYIVRVEDWSGGAGEYEVGVFNADEALTITAEVAEGGSNDVSVCVPAGEQLLVIVRPDEGFDVTLEITDADGNSLTDSIDQGFSGESEVGFYLPTETEESHAAIVMVSGFAGQSGAYTLLILPAGVTEGGC